MLLERIFGGEVFWQLKVNRNENLPGKRLAESAAKKSPVKEDLNSTEK